MAEELFPSRRFPADIEAEILLRLPVKTLKRFECACKSWSSLISSPQFQNNHFRRAQQNPLLLTLQSDASLSEETEVDDSTLRFSVYNNEDGSLVKKFTKPVPQPYFDSRVAGKAFLQSCQGLVCISSLCEPILVCNPATEEMISLPYIEELNYCFGFGYAASTQEFKVVRFVYSQGTNGCEVFTLGTSHWRQAATPPYAFSQGTAPFLHGAVHFLREIDDEGVKPTDHIAAFDIETEIYRVIPLPDYYHSLGDCRSHNIASPSDFLRLSKLRGELCLTFDFGQLDERLEVWILKDYNDGEWVKEYTISVSSLYSYSSCFLRVFPSDTMGDKSILLNCADSKGVKVLCYNSEDGAVTLMKDKEWGATFYVESFYRLKDGSLSNEISVLGSNTEAVEGRIPAAVGGARKYGSVPKKKYDGDSDDREDGDGEDVDDQDQDCDGRAAGGSGDNSPSCNDEEWSDYEDDGDEEDEEDEEIPHPPTKKRK